MTIPKPDGNGLLFVGALEWYKGPSFLLEAMPPIIAAWPHARLRLVGDGRLRRELESAAARRHIADRVEFVGRVPVTGVYRYYREADICVIPSLFETFSMVACEAMFHGLPIVASARGALPELVVNGDNGYLVEPTVPSEIAAAVLQLLRDEAHAQQLGHNGRERVRRIATFGVYMPRLLRLANGLGSFSQGATFASG